MPSVSARYAMPCSDEKRIEKENRSATQMERGGEGSFGSTHPFKASHERSFVCDLKIHDPWSKE